MFWFLVAADGDCAGALHAAALKHKIMVSKGRLPHSRLAITAVMDHYRQEPIPSERDRPTLSVVRGVRGRSTVAIVSLLRVIG